MHAVDTVVLNGIFGWAEVSDLGFTENSSSRSMMQSCRSGRSMSVDVSASTGASRACIFLIAWPSCETIVTPSTATGEGSCAKVATAKASKRRYCCALCNLLSKPRFREARIDFNSKTKCVRKHGRDTGNRRRLCMFPTASRKGIRP